jgi:hypothetical protein
MRDVPCYDRLMRYCAIVASLLIALLCHAAQADGTVVELELKGGIGVATADYIISGIEYAEETGAELVIINIDTPGGLMAPMRDIIQVILGSSVPVATYVTPAGARADSAGTYIILASHIAAMAPTTHLGAATPVSMTGDDATPDAPDDASDDPSDAEEEPQTDMQPGTAMERKVLNDAIAYIRGLADRYGRNADWAEDAVVNASTLTATDALEQNVIEFVAENRSDMLQQINGYEDPPFMSINCNISEGCRATANIKLNSPYSEMECAECQNTSYAGNIDFDAPNPSGEAALLSKYEEMNDLLCTGSLPGPQPLPGAAELQANLAGVIARLGGSSPSCVPTAISEIIIGHEDQPNQGNILGSVTAAEISARKLQGLKSRVSMFLKGIWLRILRG